MTFLLAQLAVDEAVTKDVIGHRSPQLDVVDREVAVFINRFGMPRMRLECEAKRRIIEACAGINNLQDEYARGLRDEVLSALELPYANYPNDGISSP